MAEPTVTLRVRYAGSCRHPEGMVLRGAPMRPVDFPALFAIVEHPEHGLTLFDTGYTRCFSEETRRFPARFYRWLTPMQLDAGQSAREQLAAEGIDARAVRRIVISHFHADHIAGLKDFPEAQLIATHQAVQGVQGRGAVKTLLRGFLPGLLPEDFQTRALLLEDDAFAGYVGPFRAHDLFGDGSVWLVLLPGHAAGHMGLLARTREGRRFLVGDAAWTTRSFRELRPSLRVANLILDDAAEGQRTLEALHTLSETDPTLDIIPSHCAVRAAEFLAQRGAS